MPLTSTAGEDTEDPKPSKGHQHVLREECGGGAPDERRGKDNLGGRNLELGPGVMTGTRS
jgi:hypothetical protein